MIYEPRLLVPVGEDQIYELRLRIDTNDFDAGNIKVDVFASTFRPGSNPDIFLEASVEIRHVDGRPCLVVMSRGDELYSSPLADLAEFIPPALLSPDPIVGCLMRGGLIAVAEQVLTCHAETAGKEWFFERAHAIGQCIIVNLPGMTGNAVRRAIMCIVRGG